MMLFWIDHDHFSIWRPSVTKWLTAFTKKLFFSSTLFNFKNGHFTLILGWKNSFFLITLFIVAWPVSSFVVCQTHPPRKIPLERHCERSGAEFVVFLVLGGEREWRRARRPTCLGIHISRHMTSISYSFSIRSELKNKENAFWEASKWSAESEPPFLIARKQNKLLERIKDGEKEVEETYFLHTTDSYIPSQSKLSWVELSWVELSWAELSEPNE